jgi:hypothetical protein
MRRGWQLDDLNNVVEAVRKLDLHAKLDLLDAMSKRPVTVLYAGNA